MNKLKKAFVLFLILVLTFPGETAHAFSFVPKFIAHYEHHNREHHPVSFIEFIHEHFTSKAEHDKHEHHRDDQDNCPFSHNHTTVQLVYVLKKDTFDLLSASFVSADHEKSHLPVYRFSFSEYSGSIWQPPKIA